MLNGSHLEVGTHVFYGQTTNTNVNLGVYGRSGEVFEIDNISVKEVQGFASPSLDSPTGAFKLVADTSNTSNHNIRTTISISNSTDYTVSFFAKKGEYNFVSTYISALGWAYTWDLNLGTVVLGDAGIEDYGNGWFKCTISATSTSTSLSYRIYSSEFEDRNFSFTGDGTSGVYIYGAQVEALPYATSYIPTNGSAVTRVKDVATNFGDVNTFNSEEGVLFVESSVLFNDLNTERRISISNGTDSNQIMIKYDNVDNILKGFYIANGVNQGIVTVSIVVTDINKIAISWGVNNFNLWINGVKVSTDNSVAMIPNGTINSLKFNSGSGGHYFYGKVKQVQVYKEALTDSELEYLTTYATFLDLANSNNYNLILDI